MGMAAAEIAARASTDYRHGDEWRLAKYDPKLDCLKKSTDVSKLPPEEMKYLKTILSNLWKELEGVKGPN